MAFLSLYVLVLAIVSIVIVTNWDTLQKDAFNLPAIERSGAAPQCSDDC